MKLTIPPIQIEENEGFNSAKDIFSRKEFGDRLANLIAHSNGDLVFAIDAQWGEGKSTFIKMWKGHILHHREPKIHSIYFDAFANDYQKDPFLALTAEMYELFKVGDKKKKDEFIRKAGDAVKSLARGALKIGVRAGTGGFLDGSEVDAVGKGISKLLDKQVDTVVADRLKNAAKDKLALEDFRKYLEDFARECGEGMPIVFIIDELDRCRPDFALELIEQIKHLFSVPGITFLLVLNRKQLEESVRLRYGGDGTNATAYLQKFVNLWLTLPRKFDMFDDHGEKYVQHLLDSMLVGDEQILNKSTILVLKELVMYLRPSYREIERTLSYFALIQNMIGEDKLYLRYQFITPLICYLKASQPHLVDRIASNKINSQTIIEDAGLKDIGEDSEYTQIYHLTRYVIFDLSKKTRKEEMIKNGLIPAERLRLDSKIMVTVCSWLSELSSQK